MKDSPFWRHIQDVSRKVEKWADWKQGKHAKKLEGDMNWIEATVEECRLYLAEFKAKVKGWELLNNHGYLLFRIKREEYVDTYYQDSHLTVSVPQITDSNFLDEIEEMLFRMVYYKAIIECVPSVAEETGEEWYFTIKDDVSINYCVEAPTRNLARARCLCMVIEKLEEKDD